MPKKTIKTTRKTKKLFKRSKSSSTGKKPLRSSSAKKTRSPTSTQKRTRAKKPLFASSPPSRHTPTTVRESSPVKASVLENHPPLAQTQDHLPEEAPAPLEVTPIETSKPTVSASSPHEPEPDVQTQPQPKPNSDVASLQRLIQQTQARISEIEEEKIKSRSEVAPPETDPEEYDGVDDPVEEHQLYEQQLKQLRLQNDKLERKLKLTQEEFKKEKQELEKTIKELRTEVKRTAPLQESKFFSISKELREAVKAIENLNEGDFTATPPTISADADPETSSEPEPDPEQSKPASSQPKTIKVSQVEEGPKPKKNKKKQTKDKKLLITGGAIVSLLSVGGLLSWSLTRSPQIDEELVETYLQQNSGQVQGIQTDMTAVQAQNQNTPTDRYAQVPFDQTEWKVFEDLSSGYNLKYPVGITEKLHTNSSLTFLRKEGYIFKVQVYETPLPLEEFWATQKPTVNYTVLQETLHGQEALHLQLADQVEFPGDRYLLQGNGKIFDLWVAVPSQKFSQDDIERAEFMLDSFRII